VGETAVPLAPIAPDAVGKAELRGTPWDARNVTVEPLAAGQRCRVVGVEGLMLSISSQERGGEHP
jgi:membrane protein implicated in regulation of membrane protease activity